MFVLFSRFSGFLRFGSLHTSLSVLDVGLCYLAVLVNCGIRLFPPSSFIKRCSRELLNGTSSDIHWVIFPSLDLPFMFKKAEYILLVINILISCIVHCSTLLIYSAVKHYTLTLKDRFFVCFFLSLTLSCLFSADESSASAYDRYITYATLQLPTILPTVNYDF